MPVGLDAGMAQRGAAHLEGAETGYLVRVRVGVRVRVRVRVRVGVGVRVLVEGAETGCLAPPERLLCGRGCAPGW